MFRGCSTLMSLTRSPTSHLLLTFRVMHPCAGWDAAVKEGGLAGVFRGQYAPFAARLRARLPPDQVCSRELQLGSVRGRGS